MSEGEHLRLKRKPRRCRSCGSLNMATIHYGYPKLSEKLIEDIEAQKVILGGCVIDDDSAVRRRMIWNIRGDFGAEVIGSSGLGYAALR